MNYVITDQDRSGMTIRYYRMGDVVGLHGQTVSGSTRRLIMQALRKATRVLGPGQKSRIGRLGAGAAIGAVIAGFGTPVLAQTIVGTGTLGTAAGNTAPASTLQNGIIDRSNGTGQIATAVSGDIDGVIPKAVVVGFSNDLGGGGVAIGDNNNVTGGGSLAIGIGVENLVTGAYAGGYGYSNTVSATAATAIGVANVASGNTSVTIGRQNTATGISSVSIGNVNTANKDNAIAIGNAVQATGLGSIALGSGSGTASTTLDATATEASGTNAVAIGTAANATGGDTVALGSKATASGITSIAAGSNTTASGASSVALGNLASASKTYSIAIGEGAVASTNDNTLAIGRSASSTGLNGAAIGLLSRQTAGGLAVGNDTSSTGLVATSVGYRNDARGDLSSAIGASSSTFGDRSIALGSGAVAGVAGSQTTVTKSIAIGDATKAAGAMAVAVGASAQAQGAGSTAIGSNATGGANAAGQDSVAIGGQSAATGLNSIAIGLSAKATGENATAVGRDAQAAFGSTSYGVGTGTTNGQYNVAIGNDVGRLVTGNNNVAVGSRIAGATINALPIVGSYNAAFGSGGAGNGITGDNNSAFGNGAGALIKGSSNVAIGLIAGQEVVGDRNIALGDGAGSRVGSNATAVSDTISLGTSAKGSMVSAIAIGNAAVASNINATALGRSSTASGFRATAIGNNSQSVGSDAIAIGTGARAANTNSIAIGTNNNVSGANSGAIGDPNIVTGTGSYALGNNNTINADGAFAIGNNITIATGLNGAIGIGDGTTVAAAVGTSSATIGTSTFGGFAGVAPTATLSVGGFGAERTITNVAAGRINSSSTDAINGSQLFSVATVVDVNTKSIDTLGNTVESITGAGTKIAPDGSLITAPSFTVAGSTYNNVGAALTALDSGNLVKQTGGNPGTGQITVGAATQGTSVSFANSAGVDRTLTGVAAGSTAAKSNDAINGSQINVLGASIASNTGGGSVYNPVTGTVTAPVINAAGANYANTTAAIEALDAGNAKANTGIANVIGGGMVIAADGTVTAPVLPVNGTNYANVADALATVGAGFNFTTGATGSGVASGTSIAAVGAGETHTITAGNNVIATQTGNDVALALNPALTGITSLAVTGGPSLSASGIDMGGDKITNLAAGDTTKASTDAVNGGQLFAGLESVAVDLGGGSTYDPVTGTVTAPSYNIAGSTYNNVGSALDALANGGASSKYFQANSTSSAATAYGVDSVAMGANAVATNDGDVALGSGSTTGTPNNGTFSINGGTVAATSPTSVVSVGAAGSERQIQNVAAGVVSSTSTDAVNGSQLFAVGTAVDELGNTLETITGGGAVIGADGKLVTAPSIAVGGATFDNVTDAIEAGDTKAGKLSAGLADALGGGAVVAPDGTVTAPTYALGGNTYNDVGAALGALANGAIGPVQFANSATPTTPNGGTPTNNVTLVGAAAGSVTLDNVKAGSLAAGSTQAVNGGQLGTLGTSIASSIGGTAVFDPLTGGVIGTAITVDGTVYTDITTAIQAAGGGLNVTTTAMGSGVANGTSVTNIGPNETMTLTAGDNIITNQTGGNVAVSLNPVVSGLTSVAITGGPTISATGITGLAAGAVTASSTDAVNGAQLFAASQNITNLTNGTAGLVQQNPAAPSSGPITVGAATGGTVVDFKNSGGLDRVLTGLAAGATSASSTEAVNGSQMFAGLGSVASGLGGGSKFDPTTGTVTMPTINVGGTAYTNLTDAVQAAGAGSKLTTAATGTGVANGTSVEAVGAGDTTTLTAGNNIVATQNGRDVTLAVNPELTGLTKVAITGGPTLSNKGITGVAAGNIASGSTDAVNGGQIFELANALGTPIGAGGAITPPSYSINGNTFSNVAGALAEVNAAITGGGIKYFHANSTLSDSAPVGQDSVAIGPISGSAGTASVTIGLNTSAGGTNAIALGNGGSAAGNNSIAIGTGNQVSGNNSGAFGDPNVITSNDSYALGNNNTIAADKAFAIGNNITIAAGQTGSIGIGDGTIVSAANKGAYTLSGGTAAAISPTAVVSVGAAGAERQVTNVAAGVVSATSTDAINGSQLFLAETTTKNTGASIGTLIGGGTKIAADGTIQTAPTFTLRGSTYNDVGTALVALASGGTGPVQYTDAATPTVPNGGNPSQNLTLVGGAAGPVSLNNLAAGALSKTSTDAVNGAQLFAVQTAADGALQRSGGTMSGAINMGGKAITNLAAPVSAGDAANKAYVDGKAGLTDELGKTAAAALGAGSTYDPATGKLSAPSYSVGGKAYGNTGAAIAATNALAVQYVADANGAPTNAVRLTGNGNGQPVAVTNVAPGVVSAGSTDAVNGGQLHTVQVLAANSLQYDRNPNGSTNFGSASLGGGSGGTTVLRNVSAGVAPTDAVNVLQLANAQASTLGLANAYTDKAFTQMAFDLKDVSRKAYAGTAAAIALQAPALFIPGAVAMRGGMGYYRGEFAMGLSVRATSDNGRWSLTGGVSGGKHGGVAASAGIDFVLGN